MDKPPSYNAAMNPSAPLMTSGYPVLEIQPSANPHWQPPQHQVHTQQHHMQQQYPQYHGQPVVTQQPQQTVVIINQQVHYGPNPMSLVCPHCQQQTITKVDYQSNWITHMSAGLLCILGLCCCACIPYCVDGLKDAVHRCGKCNNYLGMYSRSSNRPY